MSLLNGDYFTRTFCDKCMIEVLIKPSVLTAKRTHSSAAESKTRWKRSKEEVTILTQKCINCNKTSEEIENEWRKEVII
jgi:DNA-directed RNA polymerase subunit RPC12/RpoP